MTLTGIRLDEFNELKRIYRNEKRRVHRDDVELNRLYNEAVHRLHKLEAAVEKRRAAIRKKVEAKKEALRLKKEAISLEKKVLRKERAKAKRQAGRVKNNIIFRGSISNDAELNALWKSIRGLTVRFVEETYGVDNTLVVSDKSYKEFRKDYLTILFNASYDTDLSEVAVTNLFVLRSSTISAQKIFQAFRDGISHCVFEPLLLKLESALSLAESKATIMRRKQQIKKLQNYRSIYDLGVPEDKMEEVAKASGFKILICDTFNQELKCYNNHGKSIVSFTNTREHHLDVGHLTLNEKGTIVSLDEMKVLLAQAQNEWSINKKFYMIDDFKDGVCRKLYTLNGTFRLFDSDSDHFEMMNKEIDLNKYGFDALKNSTVNNFIKESRIINSWNLSLNDAIPDKQYDMPKAYTQFKKCHMYQGFLGVIHQWRSGNFSLDFIKEHIGIYRFTILSSSFEKYGLVCGSVYVLPSVEILYFVSKGCSVLIDAGVWGSRMDFDFPDFMLEDKRYARWSGRLGMEHAFKTYTFPCTTDWAGHLKCSYDKVYHWGSMASVKIPNKSIVTYHHILSFITSYLRIQMMEAIDSFKDGTVCNVVLDGLYFKGNAPSSISWYKDKTVEMKEQISSMEWYSPSIVSVDWSSLVYSSNTCLTGQGGSGKTFSVMTDTCYNNILFVTPQHVLGADVKEKYGNTYTTIHKLIGIDCVPWKDEKPYPAVLFVDELTQIHAAWIQKVFEMYPDSLIFVAGDISYNGQWFQCRGGDGMNYTEIWKPTCDVVEIAGDRRSLDSELKNFKILIREYMKSIFIDGNSGEEYLMRDWCMKHCATVDFFTAASMFSSGDTWIAGTHRTSNALLSLGIVSGYYKPGGFVSSSEADGYMKRGSFTIHSYQGKTVNSGKIFISISDCFEYAMFYTAVSRAVRFDQLVFVC